MKILCHRAADVAKIAVAKADDLYQSKKIVAVAEADGIECVAARRGDRHQRRLQAARVGSTRSLRDGIELQC